MNRHQIHDDFFNVFKQARSANELSPISLSKYASCNSCANIACSDSSRCHNYGRQRLISSALIVQYRHRTDTVLTCNRPKQTNFSHACQTKLTATREIDQLGSTGKVKSAAHTEHIYKIKFCKMPGHRIVGKLAFCYRSLNQSHYLTINIFCRV